MASALLTRVKSKMHLTTRRRVLHLLDGQYRSLLRGRSMDFDDLRGYQPGDEVKDIDWKASARSHDTLVRRYHAERRQRVLFVVDRGRNMAALAGSGEQKRSIAALAVGVLGYLALRHGDEVALATGDESGIAWLPYRTSELQLERMLHEAHDRATLDGSRSDLLALLERVRATASGRHFVVVVADEIAWTERLATLARRLAAQHDLVWLEIPDADPIAGARPDEPTYDVAGTWRLPSFLREDRQLEAEYDYAERRRRVDMEEAFEAAGISFARLESEDEVIPELLRLMKARARARR